MVVHMKLIDFENLTQYMSPKSLLFYQESDTNLAFSQIRYIPNSPNLQIVTGKKPMTLSQLTARLHDMSDDTQLLSTKQQPIFGFHLSLDNTVPHIILK